LGNSATSCAVISDPMPKPAVTWFATAAISASEYAFATAGMVPEITICTTLVAPGSLTPRRR
jgi:hypothetical protein